MCGHSQRAGRAARKRRRKRESTILSVSLCHQPQYVRLMKFLHQRGFSSTVLQPVLFTDTGRGLQTLKSIKPGELVISLPESCLITTSTVLDSYVGQYVKSWKPCLSPLLALCVFLVCERHRGEASDWFPYIDVLPSTYTCPAYFTDDIMAVLPASVRRRALEQREVVQELHSSNRSLRYQQAFINYGSHDNQRLLLEYGFVATANPHSVVYVDTELLCDVLRSDRSLDQKIKFLRDNSFLHNLTVSSEGPSWRLMTALRLLSLPQSLYHHWKAVLLGQVVCEEREEWSLQTAKTLCQRLLQDTYTALHKISHLLQDCEQPVREQLHVVRSLQQEERCILGSCLEALESSLKQTDNHQLDVSDVS
ncbi:SET domain-containing protein 4-like [Parambassis ranga]|uniref:SET domain-containing protein 4-like n=1 Tax=Parambassis ranga TaxID=210632 RepID=A0A6P7JSS7_9TELE|nr:SET domain-containing protein 4-like [Parambassis ranga]